MIRVAIVDDHPHVAIALRALLDQTADLTAMRALSMATAGAALAIDVKHEALRSL